MVEGYHDVPDEHVLSLKSKRVTRNGCCNEPYPDPSGRCMGCGAPHKAGQEAYDVTIGLPNGVSFKDPQIQEHLSQVVPPDWPGFISQLQGSDRDSSAGKNTYKLLLFKRQSSPDAMGVANASRLALPELVKIADQLDNVKEHGYSVVVDSMIRSITATNNCGSCEAFEDGISDLRSYLSSSKFHDDTTVQVSDVLMRLDEIGSSAFGAQEDGWRQQNLDPSKNDPRSRDERGYLANLHGRSVRAMNKCTACGEDTEFKLCDECNEDDEPT